MHLRYRTRPGGVSAISPSDRPRYRECRNVRSWQMDQAWVGPMLNILRGGITAAAPRSANRAYDRRVRITVRVRCQSLIRAGLVSKIGQHLRIPGVAGGSQTPDSTLRSLPMTCTNSALWAGACEHSNRLHPQLDPAVDKTGAAPSTRAIYINVTESSSDSADVPGN